MSAKFQSYKKVSGHPYFFDKFQPGKLKVPHLTTLQLETNLV